MLNMLNVHTTERITAGTSAGLSAGSVMLANCCQREAPSTLAASYSSPGMDCSAPSDTTIMNGKESQALVASAVTKEVPGEANHDTGWPLRFALLLSLVLLPVIGARLVSRTRKVMSPLI